jgi:hypothetical protein
VLTMVMEFALLCSVAVPRDFELFRYVLLSHIKFCSTLWERDLCLKDIVDSAARFTLTPI